MKKHDIVNIAKQLLVIMLLVFVGCTKDIQPEQKTPKITETTVESQTTRVFFSWEVDYPGMVSSLVKVSLNQDMTDAVSFGDDASVEGGHFSAAATNLKKATKYYYCFTVTNPGLAYQSEVNTVTTLTDTPEVKTVEVSVTGQNSATVSCEVTDDCGASVTERGVYYSTNPLPNAFQEKVSSGNGLGTYSVTLTDLFAGKTYYVCAYATNANGTACGEELTFTTEPGRPGVTTNDVTEITWSSAKGGGTIQSDGGSEIIEKGLCWSNSHNPDINGTHTNAGAGMGSFTVEMTGLASGTTYYVRAYAKNSTGESYGEEKSFTTNVMPKPTVTTASVSQINFTNATAVGGGEVTDDGGSAVTERGIYYGTTPNPVTTGTKLMASSGGTGSFTCTMTGLVEGTLYYVCAYAINGQGTGYGSEMSFLYNPGVINGAFSVSSSKKVYFSRGNLQYRASDGRWCFAEHQYDYIGSANSNISSTYSDYIDLFGWGTSGWNSGNTYYRPYDSNNSNGSLYGPGDNYDLTGNYANADWGVYNAIYNGGNQAGQWRTLTNDEWVYVFRLRSDAYSKRGQGKVNGVCGMILLPDNWTLPSGLSFTPGESDWSNVYTAAQWLQMEANGAVFLPAAGYRSGTTVNNVGTNGWYWSSSVGVINGARYVRFNSGNLFLSDSNYRYSGQSVRLVTPAE